MSVEGLMLDLGMNPDEDRNSRTRYQVFECYSSDQYDYDSTKVLFETDDLAQAHTFAYMKWKLSLREKKYTIVDVKEACRDHYGLDEAE